MIITENEALGIGERNSNGITAQYIMDSFICSYDAAVLHVLQHDDRIADDGPRLRSIDVGDKSNAARIVFIQWVVKALVFALVSLHSSLSVASLRYN